MSNTAASQAFVSRTFPQRLGIFVDVQNMFYSAKLLHQSKVDYGRLLKELTGSRHLVRALAYLVQKPDINQASFHEALTRFGYDIKVKEMKSRVDAEGKAQLSKSSWEVELTLDAISLAPKLDTAILITGDGNYTPLVWALKSQGCRVEVVGFDRATAGELIQAADQYIPIQDSWIFKEKRFESNEENLTPSPVGAMPDSSRINNDDWDEKQPVSNVSARGIVGKK